jgi:hypothetical protein
MIHLTFTGYHAGRPLCGCNKVTAKERGESFYHAEYAGPRELREACPLCRALWEDRCYRTVPGAWRSFTGAWAAPHPDGRSADCDCEPCRAARARSVREAVDREIPDSIGRKV